MTERIKKIIALERKVQKRLKKIEEMSKKLRTLAK